MTARARVASLAYARGVRRARAIRDAAVVELTAQLAGLTDERARSRTGHAINQLTAAQAADPPPRHAGPAGVEISCPAGTRKAPVCEEQTGADTQIANTKGHSMSFKISRPQPSAGGSGFNKDAHEGHLIVAVHPVVENIVTRLGPSDMAKCGYVVCASCAEMWTNAGLFGSVLVPGLCASGEDIVVFRLQRGEAKPGRSAPWLPVEPSDVDINEVDALFAKIATQMPSGRIIIDGDALAGLRPNDDDDRF